MTVKCRVLLDDSVYAGNGKLIQIARINSPQDGAVLPAAGHLPRISPTSGCKTSSYSWRGILVACSRRVGGWAPGRARGPSAGKEQSTARPNQ